MQSSNIINFKIEKQVRELSTLQLANLKYYFDTESHSDPILYGLIKKEVKRRVNRGEMYEDVEYVG